MEGILGVLIVAAIIWAISRAFRRSKANSPHEVSICIEYPGKGRKTRERGPKSTGVQCRRPKDHKKNPIFSDDAVDILSDKLTTPLQIEHYLTLAIEEAYKVGVKPVTADIIESVVAIDELESRLTRYGYDAKSLSNVLNVRPFVIRSFFHGQLPPGQTQEIQKEMLAIGLPI